MIRFGWIEWDEIIGPASRVYAEDRLLPTIGVYWSHLHRNNGEHFDWCPTCSDEQKYPDDLMVSVFFALENGMFSETLLSLRQGLWSVDMALLPEYNPENPLRSGRDATCYGVDIEHGKALCRHDGNLPIHFEDPEDYEDLMRILARWSNLEKVYDDDPVA